MKKLAIAVLYSLSLAACPMTDNTQTSTTPDPIRSSQEDCSLLVDLTAPEPAPQPWEGKLPQGSAASGWVLATLDDKDPKWLLMLVEAEKKIISQAFLLNSVAERLDALNKVSEQQFRSPGIFLAILSGVRPFPQPGPPGEPGKWIFQQALSTVVAEQRIRTELGELMQQPGK